MQNGSEIWLWSLSTEEVSKVILRGYSYIVLVLVYNLNLTETALTSFNTVLYALLKQTTPLVNETTDNMSMTCGAVLS